MINEWQPAVAPAMANGQQIDSVLLQKFAQVDTTAPLASVISQAEQDNARHWLRLTEEDWQSVLATLDSQQLFPLAVFFTLAEQQFSGWQCGARNPAIWIFRWLRQHDQLPDKEHIRALKKMTDNRFIPYGSVL